MDAIEAIRTRRSIRKYTDEPVCEDMVLAILRAAMSAPSAGDQRAWRFIVADDRAVLDAIPGWHPHAKMLKQAPLAIVVCADTAAESHKGYWILDCAAATQNMLLAAHALGLGAVWLGVHPRPERMASVKAMFRLPPGVEPLSIVAFGHPAEEKPPEDRFDPAKVHRNRW
jgi:nitroreductase